MKTIAHRLTKVAATTAATALAATALLVPAAAQAAPILAHDGSHTCAVTGGELSWGVKESFRSYITSTIAHGGWEVSDDMAYETPDFLWSDPSGELDAASGEGAVSFVGEINFHGHDGVLDTSLANPSIEVRDDGSARLLLDVRSNDAEGDLEIDEQQVYFAKIESIDANDFTSGGFAFEQATAVLTADGAKAFGGFYSSGDELDPVTLTLQLGPCEGGESEAGHTEQSETESEAETGAPIAPAAEPSVPWVPIAVGGVAAIVLAIALGMLFSGRKKSEISDEDRPAAE